MFESYHHPDLNSNVTQKDEENIFCLLQDLNPDRMNDGRIIINSQHLFKRYVGNLIKIKKGNIRI
jgi:hypothetical protein